MNMNISGTRCHMCGALFDEWDTQQDAKILQNFYYGSVHDGERIECHMCCNCFDKLVDEYILPKCRINPIYEEGVLV